MTQDVIDDLQTEADNFDTHAADTANPHLVTKAQVGLGDVDNTSDATKNSATATLTNKTLTTPTIASFANATHNHSNAAGGGQITDAALSAAVGIAKGGTGKTTAADAINALLPSQVGNADKALVSSGTVASWASLPTEPIPKWKAGRWYSLQQVLGSNFGATTVLTINQIYATPLWVPRGSGPIDRVGFAVSTGVSGGIARIMYFASGADGHPGALVFDFGTVSVATAGDKEISGAWTLPPGLGWLAVVSDKAITAGRFETVYFSPLGNSTQGGSNGSPSRANGGTTAPDPFGTTSITYINDGFPRLAVRAA